MRKPVYGHFTHILQKEKWYIESFCYNVVENHLYTKFEKKNLFKKLSPDVLYRGHSITYEWHIIFNYFILLFLML